MQSNFVLRAETNSLFRFHPLTGAAATPTERWSELTELAMDRSLSPSAASGQALRPAQGLLARRAVSPVEPAAPPLLHAFGLGSVLLVRELPSACEGVENRVGNEPMPARRALWLPLHSILLKFIISDH